MATIVKGERQHKRIKGSLLFGQVAVTECNSCMKARPLPLCREKTQPGKLEGPDGSWGLFSQQLLPENGKKKKNNNKKNPNQQGRNPGARGPSREVGADQMVVQLVPATTGSKRKISTSKTPRQTYGPLEREMFMEEKMPTGLRGGVSSKLLSSCFLGSQ